MILPPQSADCHHHVFGPFDRYPLAAERAYNVPEAPIEAHEELKRRVGLERSVLVQGHGHGFDNRAMLAALQKLGSRGRGIAILPVTAGEADFEGLHEAGIRGLRLNLVTQAGRQKGGEAELVRAYERLLAPRGWHLQIFSPAATLVALEPVLRACKVDVVIDHMGLVNAANGTAHAEFRTMLRLAAEKHIWFKLAGADRITKTTRRLLDAAPFMKAFADVAPERLVWGSDWPHIGFHSGTQVKGDAVLPYRNLDPEALLEVLFEAVPDPDTRKAILAGNPARLYNFPQEEAGG